jgi:pantoate--beta-alanine ligase
MGFLHEGHLSLIRRARATCRVVVLSIFVNPAQFGPGEDYEDYSRDIRGDTAKAKASGVDLLFLPSTHGMYLSESQTFVQVEKLSQYLCGASRPTHFRGVTTVVTKLFGIVKPHRAFFGQKDYQQCRIIQQMVRDLQIDVRIEMCPTLREHDGLAMSSRNIYLSPEERRVATSLYRSLQLAKQLVGEEERSALRIRNAMLKELQSEPQVKLDYLSLCDPQTLEEIPTLEGKTLIAVAAWIGKTRLIDNILLQVK